MRAWKISGRNTCEFCRLLDGKPEGDGWEPGIVNSMTSRGIRSSFSRVAAGVNVGPPPLHPDCECEIVFKGFEQMEDWPVVAEAAHEMDEQDHAEDLNPFIDRGRNWD